MQFLIQILSKLWINLFPQVTIKHKPVFTDGIEVGKYFSIGPTSPRMYAENTHPLDTQ